MENLITKERVIDGTFFSSFEEFYDLLYLLLSDDPEKKTEASLENLQALMETQKDYYVLLVWENADLTRITFGYEETARYYRQRMENDPEAAERYQEASENRGRTIFGLILDILNDKENGYQCEVNTVDGLRMADYTFDVRSLSDTYEVSVIGEDDFAEVLALYQENPEYYTLLKFEPSYDTIREDMKKCPKGLDPANKYYVVFRDPDAIAVADIYLHYPRQDAVWIDLIMLSKELQGFSYGSEILRDMLDAFAKCGFMWAEVGFVKGYQAAEKFFSRNWFVDLQTETKEEDGRIYRHMIRGLQ